jgi:hypothetical protein
VGDTLTPQEQIERQKLLTRARGILLDNALYTADHVRTYGDPISLPGIGPKTANVITEVLNSTNDAEIAYLFPYPDGIDETRFTLAPEPADEAEEDQVPWKPASVPTWFITYALAKLADFEVDFARGYLSALVDLSEQEPGFADDVLDILSKPDKHYLDGQNHLPPTSIPTDTLLVGAPEPGSWEQFRARLTEESAPAQGDYEGEGC